tara:strand:- start:787 stop:987 length:201 start_codon:yes stop_codon:yes gene_type:complete
MFLTSFIVIGCSKKCVECADCPDEVTLTDASGNDVAILEVCEDDFDSKADYDEAISITEAFGCDCK